MASSSSPSSSSSSHSRKLARFSGHGKSGKIIGRSREARLRAHSVPSRGRDALGAVDRLPGASSPATAGGGVAPTRYSSQTHSNRFRTVDEKVEDESR
jgi:hypothetical protein